ncbi:UPF0193 protein EVG1 [Lingula anatina]|uniref:UPF0193 protein EVG1 n=1 Tax=Lingula anatina TaxID=7574 RepID=A0A1S3I5D2_LINAN|nr:UPF0193 protein EVG1 [Lingula anatina]|eukprot:XP_013393041.1 UPF0193 protein EVG1 [Lingula anatina]
MADKRRQPVAQGGFWNSQPTSYSQETQQLLKQMMKESKLTNFQQRELSNKVRSGETLPVTCNPTSSAKPRQPKAKPPPQKVVNPRSAGGGIRLKETIESTGAYERPDYQPAHIKPVTEKDKERLANIMAYGEDVQPPSVENIVRRMDPSPEPEIDRFQELQDEIEERKRFLDDMDAIGQGHKYRAIISTEISQKIREMELIDQKKTKQLKGLLQLQKEDPAS